MKLKFNKNTKIFLVSDGLSIAGYNVIDVFLAVLISERIMPGQPQYIGYILSVYTLVRVLAEIFISQFSSRLKINHKIKYISFSYVIYGLFIILMGLSSNLWQVFLFQILLGFIDGTTYPLKWSIFSDIIKKSDKDNVWAIEDIVTTLAYAIAAAFIGWISQFNLFYAFVAFGILFSTSGFVFWFIKLKNYRTLLFR